MARLTLRIALPAATLLLLAACATPPGLTPPTVSAALAVPAGQQVFLEALATGVQIYECVSKPGQMGSYEWIFKAPEASLADRAGRALGKHYAGPTWQSVDGSEVVGEVKARDAGPDAQAIPWLLLSAKSVKGAGMFGKTASIQRVATTGGVTPAAAGCGAATHGQVARVPYTATYFFYAARP
jgi:hypothetical protein